MSSPYPEPTPLTSRRPVPVQRPGVAPQMMDQRIGDAERSRVCEELSVHYAAGRLSDDELDARVNGAMAARTWGELRPLVCDLPSASPVRPTPTPPPARPGTPWSAVDVLALVTLVGTLGIALIGACAVLLGGQPGYVAASILTALTAGVGGMALTQVLHRSHRFVVDRTVSRLSEQERRAGQAGGRQSLSGPA